jgi:hypothetical protein
MLEDEIIIKINIKKILEGKKKNTIIKKIRFDKKKEE